MKILSWNINGLRAAHKKGFLNWFNKQKPDILCLQETKAEKSVLPQEVKEINKYYFHITPAEKKGYSGVAIYSKEKPISLKEGFDREGRVQAVEFKHFILFNVYFPNGKASRERLKYKMDFYEKILKKAGDLKKKGKKVIICGDVNTAHKEIDLSRPKQNEGISGFLPQERAWIDKLLTAGFIDTFREFNKEPGQYSWWDLKTRARDRNIGWRIDYFFISKNLKPQLEKAYILSDVKGSDHCPVGISLNF